MKQKKIQGANMNKINLKYNEKVMNFDDITGKKT